MPIRVPQVWPVYLPSLRLCLPCLTELSISQPASCTHSPIFLMITSPEALTHHGRRWTYDLPFSFLFFSLPRLAIFTCSIPAYIYTIWKIHKRFKRYMLGIFTIMCEQASSFSSKVTQIEMTLKEVIYKVLLKQALVVAGPLCCLPRLLPCFIAQQQWNPFVCHPIDLCVSHSCALNFFFCGFYLP